MSKSTIWSRVKMNEKRPCKITTCKNMRVKMNGFCGMHQRRVERWGHPKGYAWQKRLIDPYLEKAEEFVQEHWEHRAVKAGVDYLNHALATAYLQTTPPSTIGRLTRVLRYLHDAGVTGEQIVVRCIAVLFYSEWHHHHDREFQPYVRNMGAYVLRAAPGLGKAGTRYQQRRVLGNFIWNNLSKLLVGVTVHYRRARADEAALQQALSTPFPNPTGD